VSGLFLPPARNPFDVSQSRLLGIAKVSLYKRTTLHHHARLAAHCTDIIQLLRRRSQLAACAGLRRILVNRLSH
jgi:hypothetical protein